MLNLPFMHFRIFTVLVAFLWTFTITAQMKDAFGELTQFERQFTSYEKDQAASAIVLYEKADNYFEVIHQRIWLIKEYHGKIKILTDQGYGEGTISIPIYKGENSSEKVEGVRAITHNGTLKTSLSPNGLYTKQISERFSELTFTFPNIKVGSILEYRYKLISPFIYNLSGWTFQSGIPKIYSEYNASIPANYRYNRNLSGYLKLAINESTVKKGCFVVEGFNEAADCEVLKYAMKDIPAFRDEEFMLAASNYNSRIDFELSEYHRLDGTTDKYTKSWEDVDREFRGDQNIGRQLTKKGYFEKNVPESLLMEGDALTRAKNIYEFVRKHYTWNGNYGIYRDIRVKEAFDEKIGNVGEINIALINLLNAAAIPTQLMLTSTRGNGLPKKSHPVMTDFNYIIARANIDGKVYWLDATDKHTPFGLLPYRSLNYYGRVMDFKNESFWEDLLIEDKNKYVVRAKITFDPEQQTAQVTFDEINIGYDAVARRQSFDEQPREQYLENVEGRISGVEIETYELLEERNSDRMVSERFGVTLENRYSDELIYFDPFIVRFFDNNPLESADRKVPVDFGYTRNFQYTAQIVVPDGFEPDQMPESREIILPENRGMLKFTSAISGNNLHINYNLILNRTHFTPDQYPELRDLFKKAVETENTTVLVFRKKQV